MNLTFNLLRKIRMVTLWIIFISFAHLYPGWFSFTPEAEIIKEGMENAGLASATLLAPALLEGSENIGKLAGSVKNGSKSIAKGLQANADTVWLIARYGMTLYAAYTIYNYYYPGEEQKEQAAKSKLGHEILATQEAFGNCLLKNNKNTELTQCGFPSVCSKEANEFLMKAGTEKYKEMISRYKSLN